MDATEKFHSTPMCVECGIRKCNARRGLCSRCYGVKRIRDKYPADKPGRPKQGMRVLCQNCQKNKANCWFSLCFRCYSDKEIRAKFKQLQGTRGAVKFVGDIHEHLESLRSKHPLWQPCLLPADSPEYAHLVDQRIAAGLPPRHPLEELQPLDLD